MSARAAVQAFTEQKLNCSQSVLAAFASPPEAVAQAKGFGGGRAPNNQCGALYAALQLVADPASAEILRAKFVRQAGSEQCRQIRTARTLTCAECVQLAASLVAELDANLASLPVA